ncbi:phosphatidylinositol-glycan biosynthesis class W protein-like [Uranotaenia lowii]|uniref:phosphatidylinositol-glycan biosynthesis class W protein-like n=1 Tax=Uranotaenia lowii TaxID=190385 RepID=UPI002478C740|nr:phosphatidylinositol-glycan biosynthesis class W protein-like [Uranotaenia lowii]
MDPAEYKVLHESAMQNNNGTSALDVFLHIVPSFFTTFHTVQLIQATAVVHIPGRFLLEFGLIVIPFVLMVTTMDRLAVNVSVTLLLITAVSVVHQMRHKTHFMPFVQIPGKQPQFVTAVRALINMMTAVCILAVDFKAFPRELAKTETFGFGLMDVGVGLYVFSNGIVYKVNKEQKLDLTRLKNVLVGSCPLVVLGATRWFVIQEIDYQQHVSEYGVHWNFFLTLAVIKIVGTLIMDLVKEPETAKFIAISLLCCHEMFLHLGVSQYVMNEKIGRESIIDANREGISSIPGYIALYLASVYLGSVMRPGQEIQPAKKFLRCAIKLTIIAAICWKMIYVCEGMFGVSRRLANMGYVFWILSIGSSMCVLFMFFEVFIYFVRFEEPKTPEQIMKSDNFCIPYLPLIFEAINANGLVFFLAANLLTGLVNMMFQTMLLEIPAALTIISYYIFILCVVSVFLNVNNIKLKIW